MKNIIILVVLFVNSTFTISEAAKLITTTGYGQDMTIESSIHLAKTSALSKAKLTCKMEAVQLTEWSLKIVGRKEGSTLISATSDFECMAYSQVF